MHKVIAFLVKAKNQQEALTQAQNTLEIICNEDNEYLYDWGYLLNHPDARFKGFNKCVTKINSKEGKEIIRDLIKDELNEREYAFRQVLELYNKHGKSFYRACSNHMFAHYLKQGGESHINLNFVYNENGYINFVSAYSLKYYLKDINYIVLADIHY